MAGGVEPRETRPVAEVWPEWVLQRLVAAGRLTVDEVIDAAAAAVCEQLAMAGVVGVYRMAPDDGVSLVEGLFGVESARGVRAFDEEPLEARVS